jgi:hypothetical protein
MKPRDNLSSATSSMFFEDKYLMMPEDTGNSDICIENSNLNIVIDNLPVSERASGQADKWTSDQVVKAATLLSIG